MHILRGTVLRARHAITPACRRHFREVPAIRSSTYCLALKPYEDARQASFKSSNMGKKSGRKWYGEPALLPYISGSVTTIVCGRRAVWPVLRTLFLLPWSRVRSGSRCSKAVIWPLDCRYAVACGKNPGIYDSWAECQDQIKGFKGAVFKSFPSKQEAQEFCGQRGGRTQQNGTSKASNQFKSTSRKCTSSTVQGSLRDGHQSTKDYGDKSAGERGLVSASNEMVMVCSPGACPCSGISPDAALASAGIPMRKSCCLCGVLCSTAMAPMPSCRYLSQSCVAIAAQGRPCELTWLGRAVL